MFVIILKSKTYSLFSVLLKLMQFNMSELYFLDKSIINTIFRSSTFIYIKSKANKKHLRNTDKNTKIYNYLQRKSGKLEFQEFFLNTKFYILQRSKINLY